MVVELEGHLHVQAHELGQVTVSVGVLGSEHTTDGVNFSETRQNNDNTLIPKYLVFKKASFISYK